MRGLLALAFCVGLLLGTNAAADAGHIGGGGGAAAETAASIMTKFLTVDGPTSQADADFLDGVSSSGFSQTTTMAGAGVTCADGAGVSTLALDITCAAAGALVVVPLVNSDSGGCVVTVAETTASLGCVAVLSLSSSAGGVVTVADVSNILEVDGSWLPSVGDTLTIAYQDLANDRWGELSRSTTNGIVTMPSVYGFTLFDSANGADLVVGALTGVTGFSTLASSDTSGSAIFLSTNAGFTTIGQRQNQSANANVFCVGDGMDVSGGSANALWCTAGGGLFGSSIAQAAACAGGVLALDPTSSDINIDANGAACVVTLAETTADALAIWPVVTISITTSPGAGLVTFPDVADIHDGPALCTTTGIGLNSAYTIHYSDMANDKWVGVGCSAN